MEGDRIARALSLLFVAAPIASTTAAAYTRWVQRWDLRVERTSTAQVATRNTTAKAAMISQ